jgi:hypothetical protein
MNRSRRPDENNTHASQAGVLDVISGLMQIETLSTREMLGFLRVDREQGNLTMVAEGS